jgi:hypothetical protein
LLVVVGVVLGATVFREQIVHAATPFQNVVITNTATNPIPVQQAGTSAVSGTVKLDPSGNTVGLDATDSGHIAATDSHLANLDAAASTTVSRVCVNVDSIDNDGDAHTICSTDGSWDISTIVATGMDDRMALRFENANGDVVFALDGAADEGTSMYQLNLPVPLRASKIEAACFNLIDDCGFRLEVLGTTNN